MGRCESAVRELRFVIKEELTEAYAAVEAAGDCPMGVQGWHHKSFPSSKNVVDILTEWIGSGDYLLSGLEAPEA